MWEEKSESGGQRKEVKEEARGKWRGRKRIRHRNLSYTLSPGFCSSKETVGTVGVGPGVSRGTCWGSRRKSSPAWLYFGEGGQISRPLAGIYA